MGKISALILAKNEEKNIRDCIDSVSFVDEILVIDDFSTDATKEIAESLGARVVQHALNQDWAQQRRFAIEEAKNEWILFLDADERITPELREEIKVIIDKNEKYMYALKRVNVFHHNKATHGALRPDYVNRLLPRDGASVDGYVHELITSPYDTKVSKQHMLHYTYDNWHQYFNKFNNYTTAAANNYKDCGKTCSFVKDILLRPVWAFIKIYFIQKGFLDGKMGFILSVYHYFYTITKYIKLYYLLKDNGRL